MASSSKVFTVTVFVLLMLFGYSTSLSNTKCFPLNGVDSICYALPDPLVSLSWSGAMQWCKSIGATLPTPDTSQRNTVYKNAVSYFGLHTETIWLGANLTYDPDEWYWTNGSLYTGTVENSNVHGKTHAYIIRNGTETKYVAASPFDIASCLMQFPYTELYCATSVQNSYWTSERCYLKLWYWTSWYQYRYYYGQTYFACIDNIDDFSRWLEDLRGFWIGLRSSWWTWYNFATDNSYEVMETYFGNLNDLPSGNETQCLASYGDGNGNQYWINPDCISNLPFICQYDGSQTIIPPSVSPTTAPQPITSTPNAPSTAAEINPTTTSSALTQVTITPTTVSAGSLPTTAPPAAGFSPTTTHLPITSTPNTPTTEPGFNPIATSSTITQFTITPSTASPWPFPTSTPSAMFTTVPPIPPPPKPPPPLPFTQLVQEQLSPERRNIYPVFQPVHQQLRQRVRQTPQVPRLQPRLHWETATTANRNPQSLVCRLSFGLDLGEDCSSQLVYGLHFLQCVPTRSLGVQKYSQNKSSKTIERSS